MFSCRHPAPPSSRTGFTLVELLCVTALIAAAAVLVSVRLAGATEEARLRSARLEIEGALRRARQFTASRHRPAWLEIDPNGPRVRAALAEREAVAGTWKTLEHVQLANIEVGGLVSPASEPVRIRVTAAGVTLPWKATLQAGTVHVRISSDGIGDTIQIDSSDHGREAAR